MKNDNTQRGAAGERPVTWEEQGWALRRALARSAAPSVSPHQVSIIHLLLNFRSTYLKGYNFNDKSHGQC